MMMEPTRNRKYYLSKAQLTATFNFSVELIPILFSSIRTNACLIITIEFTIHSESRGSTLDHGSDCRGAGHLPIVLSRGWLLLRRLLGCGLASAAHLASARACHLRLHHAVLGLILVLRNQVGLLLIREHLLVVDVDLHPILVDLLLAWLDLGARPARMA